MAWFKHNVQPIATAKARSIYRNTRGCCLNLIAELTGLDLKDSFDDHLLRYIALQLDATI